MVNGELIFRACNDFKGTDMSDELRRYINQYPKARCEFDGCTYNSILNRYTIKLQYDEQYKSSIELLIENHYSFKFWIKRL